MTTNIENKGRALKYQTTGRKQGTRKQGTRKTGNLDQKGS